MVKWQVFAGAVIRVHFGNRCCPLSNRCLLVQRGGADVNVRDHDGNTPLHETFLTDVEEELLKPGANVNARNNDGETPIFTTVMMLPYRLRVIRYADGPGSQL